MLGFLAWVYLTLFLIRPQEYVSALEGIPIVRVTLLMAFAAWLMSKKRLNAPPYPLMILFAVFSPLSLALTGWVGGAFDYAIKFIPVILSFYVLAAAAESRQMLRLLLRTMAVCSVILAIHGIQQFHTGLGWTGLEPHAGRIIYLGVFNDPNDLGMLFVIALPVCHYFLRHSGLIMKLAWLAGIGCLLYGIFLTDSRGAMVGTMGLLMLLLWRRRGAIVSALLVVPGVMGLLMLPTRATEISASEASAQGRVQAWYDGLQMFKARPLSGVGVRQFMEHHERTAHNSYVLVLAEQGIIGYGLWIGLVGYCLYMLYLLQGGNWRVRRDKQLDPNSDLALDRDLATTLFAALTAYLMTAFFLSRTYMLLLYILLGMIAGHYVASRDRTPSAVPSVTIGGTVYRYGFFVMASAVFLYLMVKVLLSIS